jgi:hypothetical protein
MSVVVGVLVVLALVIVLGHVTSRPPDRRRDDQPVLGGPGPRAPGGHPVPGVGPDGRP